MVRLAILFFYFTTRLFGLQLAEMELLVRDNWGHHDDFRDPINLTKDQLSQPSFLIADIGDGDSTFTTPIAFEMNHRR